ncbi:Oidioi.mRNA.OKI2018_I69.chr1.g1344.t1.cds [Oikopleura dioica]|uniref:Oidioi.mRNA.OKI2018_I69.chr1.g1344.t1.cds n=1 Tax=Oikopleura dioica TaxID=34765 RepID=A0ABN7SRE7_OIKDI|nr:Oidioi.mRNA.OKI2018_I69.chr1.g1344.t1.cds [Oikopleura dioica]
MVANLELAMKRFAMYGGDENLSGVGYLLAMRKFVADYAEYRRFRIQKAAKMSVSEVTLLSKHDETSDIQRQLAMDKIRTAALGEAIASYDRDLTALIRKLHHLYVMYVLRNPIENKTKMAKFLNSFGEKRFDVSHNLSEPKIEAFLQFRRAQYEKLLGDNTKNLYQKLAIFQSKKLPATQPSSSSSTDTASSSSSSSSDIEKDDQEEQSSPPSLTSLKSPQVNSPPAAAASPNFAITFGDFTSPISPQTTSPAVFAPLVPPATQVHRNDEDDGTSTPCQDEASF